MFEMKRLVARMLLSAALICALGLPALAAQDAALEDIQYSEDYERVQGILKVKDLQKRADRILTLYKDRPGMAEALQTYVDSLFARDLETLMKQSNWVLLRTLCERTLKIRPRFGEVYLYHGVALKNLKDTQGAMNAFAKGAVVTGQFQKRNRQQLELMYRAQNKGSLIGMDKLISQAAKELR